MVPYKFGVSCSNYEKNAIGIVSSFLCCRHVALSLAERAAYSVVQGAPRLVLCVGCTDGSWDLRPTCPLLQNPMGSRGRLRGTEAFSTLQTVPLLKLVSLLMSQFQPGHGGPQDTPHLSPLCVHAARPAAEREAPAFPARLSPVRPSSSSRKVFTTSPSPGRPGRLPCNCRRPVHPPRQRLPVLLAFHRPTDRRGGAQQTNPVQFLQVLATLVLFCCFL